jgi:hypothetical protein
MSKEVLLELAKWLLTGIVLLIIPVLLWNVWFLDYIDKHGKLWAWVCAPLFAFASAGIVVGFDDVKKNLTGIGPEGPNRPQINPFWGWFGVSLVISVVIVALSNT